MKRAFRCGPCFAAAALPILLANACTAQRNEQLLFAVAPGSPIDIEGSPSSVVLGDVNQDGQSDAAVMSMRGVTVLLGQGDGRFRATPGSPVQVPEGSTEMALGDLNGDGKLDLALASHGSYSVTILHGDGAGAFAPAPQPPVIMKEGQRPHTHGLHVGDLNGDGSLDLVTMNSDDNDVSIAFNDGKGGFTRASSSFGVRPSPYPGALGDVNNDGHLDIIATSTGRHSSAEEASTNALIVLMGDGKGGFRSVPVPLKTVLPWFVVVADLNADKNPDLLATHTERRELSVLIGDGKGAFTEMPDSPHDLGGRHSWYMGAIDVNGDGHLDVAAANGDGVRVMLGDGRGGFHAAPGSPFGTPEGTWQLAVGDVNGDAKPDVVTTNLEGGSVSVLLVQ
jgi:hypothetical protein